MFRKLFGKSPASALPTDTSAPDTRGLEVVEEDPDTAWSKWAEAVAEHDNAFAPTDRQELQPLLPVQEVATQPMGLEAGDACLQDARSLRREGALALIDTYHRRIAATIRTLWGHPECSAYINKLIMEGGDGMGHQRIGFHQEAVQAMMTLSDLHDAEFGGPADSGRLPLF